MKSLLDLAERFPDEQSAREWFEATLWDSGRCCGHCGSLATRAVPSERPMPYWCPDCRSYFSVRTGTVMANSRVPLRKWAFAVYIVTSNPKGTPSTRLAQYIGVTQGTAWFMLQRMREAVRGRLGPFHGPVEVDEAFVGGLEKNKHADRKLKVGGGTGGKIPVVGAKDRKTGMIATEVISTGDAATITAFTDGHAASGATVYTDGTSTYKGNREHDSVAHSRGEYVKGDCHTNGIESFWAILKRAYKGTWHWVSRKHLHRYVAELAWRQGVKGLGVAGIMEAMVRGMTGRGLTYERLIGSTA